MQQGLIRVAFLGKNASRGGTMRITSYLLKCLDKERFHPLILMPTGGDLVNEYRRHAQVDIYEQSLPPSIMSNLCRRAGSALLDRTLSHPKAPQFARDAQVSRTARRFAQKQSFWVQDRLREFQPHLIVRTYNMPMPMFDEISTPSIPQIQQFTLSGANLNCMSAFDMERIFARSTAFICEGVGVRDELHRCWGVPLDRIHTVCLGIDLTLRDEQLQEVDRPRRASLQISDDALVIGAMGAWYYSKGVDLWIEAAALLRARYAGRELKFLWIGGRTHERQSVYGRSILNLIEEHGLQEDVIIVGDQLHVYPYLDMCDIFVQPSRTDAFPHATLEAMAVGKPVIAFPQGVALEDYAQNALVRVGEISPDALAEGIASLIDHSGLRDRLGQSGLRLVTERLDLAESVRCYERILAAVARTHASKINQRMAAK